MPLYFITGNQNKVSEMKSIVPDIEQMEIDLPEIQDIDPRGIIKAKLEEALKYHSGPFIVEDTSLVINSMNGLPGPFIKWFLQSVGINGIWKMASVFGETDAKAQAIIGYAKDADDIRFFEGSVHGKIVEPRGEARFGWDPIFQPDGFEKTFAEMSPEEKNAISHRKQAAMNLNEFLS